MITRREGGRERKEKELRPKEINSFLLLLADRSAVPSGLQEKDSVIPFLTLLATVGFFQVCLFLHFFPGLSS